MITLIFLIVVGALLWLIFLGIDLLPNEPPYNPPRAFTYKRAAKLVFVPIAIVVVVLHVGGMRYFGL